MTAKIFLLNDEKVLLELLNSENSLLFAFDRESAHENTFGLNRRNSFVVVESNHTANLSQTFENDFEGCAGVYIFHIRFFTKSDPISIQGR